MALRFVAVASSFACFNSAMVCGMGTACVSIYCCGFAYEDVTWVRCLFGRHLYLFALADWHYVYVFN